METKRTAHVQPEGPEHIVEREERIGQAQQRPVPGGQRRRPVDTVAEFVTQALPPSEAEQERFEGFRCAVRRTEQLRTHLCAELPDRGIGLEPLRDPFGQGGSEKITGQEQAQPEDAPAARCLGLCQHSSLIHPLMDAEQFRHVAEPP